MQAVKSFSSKAAAAAESSKGKGKRGIGTGGGDRIEQLASPKYRWTAEGGIGNVPLGAMASAGNMPLLAQLHVTPETKTEVMGSRGMVVRANSTRQNPTVGSYPVRTPTSPRGKGVYLFFCLSILRTTPHYS